MEEANTFPDGFSLLPVDVGVAGIEPRALPMSAIPQEQHPQTAQGHHDGWATAKP